MKTTISYLFVLLISAPGPLFAIPEEISAADSLEVVAVGDTVSGKHRINSRIVALAASTVCLAFSAASYYYMSEADDRYDQYLHAGSPEEMNRHFDMARKLDQKAGWSLAFFEISFIVALFSFFDSLEQ